MAGRFLEKFRSWRKNSGNWCAFEAFCDFGLRLGKMFVDG